MADIVERLRGLVPHCEDHADYTEDDLVIIQAADEIERLREKNELLCKAINDIEFWVADSIATARGFAIPRAALEEKE